MKRISCAVTLLLMVALSGCTSADISKWQSLGQPHIVKQYSGGQLIGQWESTGKVQSEAQSDGWYFEDAATRKIVLVSGTVQITIK